MGGGTAGPGCPRVPVSRSHPSPRGHTGWGVVRSGSVCRALVRPQPRPDTRPAPAVQVNGVALRGAEHHQAVEALRGAGTTVQMRLWRERMVEPENAVTVTPLRPEDDYSPRERRGAGLRLPLLQAEATGPLRQRHVACLVRSEKGLGFSIAGGKGSTPYRAGDGVRQGCGGPGREGLWAGRGPGRDWDSVPPALLSTAGHLHLTHRRGGRCPPGGHSAGRRPCPLGEWGARGLCTALSAPLPTGPPDWPPSCRSTGWT